MQNQKNFEKDINTKMIWEELKDKKMIKKRNILISVYITNYNYGKYLEQSIKSVLNQTTKDFELIIN